MRRIICRAITLRTEKDLVKVGYKEQAGNNFLGVVNASIEAIERTDERVEYKTMGGVPVGYRL